MESKRRKNNRLIIDYQGRKVPLRELSQITGISYSTLYKRIQEGCNGNELVQEARRGTKLHVVYRGKLLTLKELSHATGVKYTTIRSRFKKGYSAEELVKLPYLISYKRRSSK